MRLDDAIEHLLADPTDGAALHALDVEVRHLALGACRGRSEEADDVAQDVLIALLERIHDRALRPEGSLVGLVKTMCHRTAIDRYRKRRDSRRVSPVGARTGNGEGPAGPEIWERIDALPDPAPGLPEIDPVALLDKLAADALRRRRPRDRPVLERTIAELRMRLFDPADFSSIVAHHEGIAPGAELPRKTLVRAYKRHARLREALARSAELMWEEGRLDDAERTLAHRLRDLLVYCHKSGHRTDLAE